jgi:RNA polymerase sigma factor (sigma-70 family)
MESPVPQNVAEPPLEEVLARVQPRLKRVLARYKIPPQDAEDLVQETFLIMVSKLDSIRTPEAWLLATLTNRCIIYWRKQRSQLLDLVDSTLLELLAEGESPRQELAEIRCDLESLLSNLPDRCRSVLRLRYGFGCTTTEAAEVLGFCPSSIRKISRRCLSALTRQLVGASAEVEAPGD